MTEIFRGALCPALNSQKQKKLVKGVKRGESAQVIVSAGNIKFENFPVAPRQFAILEIEGWERKDFCARRVYRTRLWCFGGEVWKIRGPGTGK
jgi:hypothetical protein